MTDIVPPGFALDEMDASADHRRLLDIVESMRHAPADHARSHLAEELRVVVDSIKDMGDTNIRPSFEIDHANERGPAVAKLVQRLHRLLTSVKLNDRLAAIAAFTALIFTDESMHARTQRTSNAIRVLFSTNVTDIATASAAASMVASFARIDSPMSVRAVEYALNNAISLIGSVTVDRVYPQLSMDRARAAMVITHLAAEDSVSNVIFFRQATKLCKDMWKVCWDENLHVRDCGVHALQAVVEITVTRSESDVAKRTMQDLVQTIRQTLSPATSLSSSNLSPCPKSEKGVPDVHGSMEVLRSLLSSGTTAMFMSSFSSELCNLVLPYQTCWHPLLRQAVAQLLPLLVKLDREQFAACFLDNVHASTLRLIRNRKFPAEERGRSLVALSEIAEQMPRNDENGLLGDMLRICRETLRIPDRGEERHQIPEDAVIVAISHLAKASEGSPIFESAVREGMLTQMFNTNFTNELVMAVNHIGHAVPSFAEHIRLRLVHLIAATLKKTLPNRGDKMSRSAPSQEEQRSERMAKLQSVKSSVPRTRSFLSLGIAPRNASAPAHVKYSQLEAGTSDRSADRSVGRQAKDYFRPVPIFNELHRIDTSSDLTLRPSIKTVNDLLKQGLMSSSLSNRGSDADPFEVTLDRREDLDNSPCVALRAIICYDFSDMQVQDFISFATEFVIGYVEYNSVKVRALAVAACAKLMECSATLWAGPKSARRLPKQLRRGIHSILSQLLSIAVADPSTDVRFAAIRSLNQPIFFPYLLQPEMLGKLFICCFDESLAMRDSALALAGCLSDRNPASILPALRCHLKHFTSVLKCEGEFFVRDRREVTELLYTIVHNAPALLMPYTTALMDAILIRLEEAHRTSDTSIALPVLKTVAEMGGTMNRIDLRPFKSKVVPLLVNSVLGVQSADSRYKIAALRALTAFVQNTGLAIEPYTDHPQLFPQLIELLRSETDPQVRLTAEILVGSLGALDPDDPKYSELVDAAGTKNSSLDKSLGSGSQSRSMFRRDSVGAHGYVPWGLSSTRPGRSLTTNGRRGTVDHGHHRQQRHPLRGPLRRSTPQSNSKVYNNTKNIAPIHVANTGEDELVAEKVEISLALFSDGGMKLMERLAGYRPNWSEEEILSQSLVSELDHPYTASPDYFPSAALDSLHKIISNPRLRGQHRDACHAIVQILISTGPRSCRFLPAVLPRIQWLLAQGLSRSSQKGTITFTSLDQHLMLRLADIVGIAGYTYLPFTFDTVLLVWNFLTTAQRSAGCITSVCTLLSRLRVAIGDEFKPVIATVLPPLLAALGQDRSANGVVSISVLHTLESFATLFGNYLSFVLLKLSKVVSSRRNSDIREEALKTLIRIVSRQPSVVVLSAVMHPLMKILARAKDRAYMQTSWEEQGMDRMSQGSKLEWVDNERLVVLAASAITEIGTLANDDFDVFVPVIAQALRASDVKSSNKDAYRALKACLMRRDPDVVVEFLSEDHETGYGSLPVLPDVQRDSDEMDTSRALLSARGFAPSVRGGALQGQPSLPEGTKTSQRQRRVHVVENALLAKWEVNHNFVAEDWFHWFESVGAVMFEQSGSPAFRACMRISDSYPQFIRELFNPAFLSCWETSLSPSTKMRICDSLGIAMSSETIPVTILQAILNLFEYMDHHESPLPVPTDLLARTACRCGAFAKAVRYREQDYVQHSKAKEQLKEDVCGENGLIEIYEKLGHATSAVGTITHYREHDGDSLEEEWFEKLQQWDDALLVYAKTDLFLGDDEERHGASGGHNKPLYADGRRWSHLLGRLRCLNELAEWRAMNALLQRAREACNGNTIALRQLALEGKGASVAFDLGCWKEFEEWVGVLQPDTYDGCFYNTLLMVKRGKDDPSCLEVAQTFIHEARSKLDLELTARISEAYQRAYVHVVKAQLLVELEEMIQYLRLSHSDSLSYGRRRLDDVWAQRLNGCKQDWGTWYRLLMLRALVQRPAEVKDQWLDFTSMCRKHDRLPMASEALRMLVSSCAERDQKEGLIASQHLVSGRLPRAEDWNREFLMSIRDLDVRFACVRHLWGFEKHVEAYETLESCQTDYWSESESAMHFEDVSLPENLVQGGNARSRLAGEVFLMLARWGDKLLDDSIGNVKSDDPLQYAIRSVRICPAWSKAWHYYGALNASRFETLMQADRGRRAKKKWQAPATVPELAHGQVGRRYLEQAVKGFFRAIDLDDSNCRIEDSLKVLTLWFDFGGYANTHVVFDECFKITNIAMWLEVVPQIIARLYSPFPGVQRGVKALLTRIGKEHPQVAVYPLTVAKDALGNALVLRRKTAVEILGELRRHHGDIVEQSELVSTELIRAAIIWVEMWFEKLEEASKLYFFEQNLDSMLEVLLTLHAEVDKGAQTVYEENFIREFGQILSEAGEFMKRFEAGHKSRDRQRQEAAINCLTAAWEKYHEVFRKVQKIQGTMMVLDLAKVSRRLSDASGLVLAIPGTYDPNDKENVVGIEKFGPQLHVLQSKQRPRKLSMLGSDGKTYEFLLKGHEDLRQDERVMQVFRLVNKIFAKSTRGAILTGVEMKTYKVVSLSPNVGLIEWVPESDTMHALVKEYREVRKILPNVEHKVMLNLAAEPDRLPLLHKVDLFELMLQQTVSVDIAKVLWLKSHNSEMWLHRRNTYAKSLASTSMTGYLLGLGDRHPSNLMIERETGRVMHIDFGDCFEVAMKREKFPEKVPFRLTRMLVQALEPCGVDGYFRHTAKATMEVLRQKNSRDSLMAMMEAFVYDPLLRWKLIGAEELEEIQKGNTNTGMASRTGVSSHNASPFSVADSNDVDVSVQSLRQYGSLAESVRQMSRQEQSVQATAVDASGDTESVHGAVPMPNSGVTATARKEDNGIDPANLQTPNGEARSRQRRAVREGHQLNDEKVTDMSNEKARCALIRFETKLYGTDFDPDVELTVAAQVDKLIQEARSIENLCALFMGWCAFW